MGKIQCLAFGRLLMLWDPFVVGVNLHHPSTQKQYIYTPYLCGLPKYVHNKTNGKSLPGPHCVLLSSSTLSFTKHDFSVCFSSRASEIWIHRAQHQDSLCFVLNLSACFFFLLLQRSSSTKDESCSSGKQEKR